MITMKLDQFKAGFFDREKVIRAVDKAKRAVYSKVGAFVRTTAKKSIKDPPIVTLKEMSDEERKNFKRRVALAAYYGRPKPKRPRHKVSSRPGHPPLNQTGLLRQFIFFAYDSSSDSVVIGPARLNTASGAPETLEYGGSTTVAVREKGRTGKRRVRIAARPFMRPAFEQEMAKLSAMWRDSIRG